MKERNNGTREAKKMMDEHLYEKKSSFPFGEGCFFFLINNLLQGDYIFCKLYMVLRNPFVSFVEINYESPFFLFSMGMKNEIVTILVAFLDLECI